MEVTLTTREVAEQFLDLAAHEVATGQKRPATLTQYQRLLPRLLALQTMSGWALGEIGYGEITKAQVAAVLRTFARTDGIARKGKRLPDGTREIVPAGLPAAETIRNARSTLGSMFAVMDAELALNRDNPAHGIDMKRIVGTRPTKEPTALSRDEVEDLIAAVTPFYRPLVTLITQTGLRSAEARGLRWADIRDGVLTVNGQADEFGGYDLGGKTRNSVREIPLTARAEALLAEQRLLTGSDVYVFATASGRTSSGANLWRAVQRACRKAYLPMIGVHDLRHSFAVLAVERGMSIPVLSKILGHHDPGFTAARYLRAEINLEAKRRALLDAFGEEGL